MELERATGRTAGIAGMLLTLAGVAGLIEAGALRRDASYLSLLGASGEPTQFRFQLAVWASAIALASVAIAVSLLLPTRPGRARWRPWVAGVLSASALFYGLVAEVPCTQGCPLPPYGQPKPQDVAHATVAVAAYFTGILAMLLMWRCVADRFLRWVSAAAALSVAGAAAAGALAALAQVQGAAGGELERLATAAGAGWLASTGLRLALRRRRPVPLRRPDGTHAPQRDQPVPAR